MCLAAMVVNYVSIRCLRGHFRGVNPQHKFFQCIELFPIQMLVLVVGIAFEASPLG